MRAIHEILTEHEENRDRTLERTMREFAEVLRAIPDEWKLRVTQLVESQQSSAQPCFSIPACVPGNPPVDITNGSTRVFYWHLYPPLIIGSKHFNLNQYLTRLSGKICTRLV